MALPGVVERFIKSDKDAQLVRNSFTGLYTLDGSEDGEKAVKLALERGGEGLVMKPQREGGGSYC